MSYNVAVIGATGNVGHEILSLLAEREFKVKDMHVIASSASIGKEVSFGEVDILKIRPIDEVDFSKIDIAFFAAGSAVSKHYGEKIAKNNCVIIDKSSYFRLRVGVPLIIPEVNEEVLASYKDTNIIASPNCIVIPLLVALKPLEDFACIKRIVISTYQAVSGAGKSAMDELYNQTKSIYTYKDLQFNNFDKQIAFNIIPLIDKIRPDGYSQEEWKIAAEVKKILGSEIEISVTCVRVPVFVGHSISVNIEFEEELTRDKAIEILNNSEGISCSAKEDYVTPVEIAREDLVYVSRIREDKSVKHGLNLFICCDNLRKGAALNAVQIAEKLTKNYL